MNKNESSKAPVLVSVYHRLYTLKACIEALLANAEAAETDLFVVSDAAARTQDEEPVRKVREYVRGIKGFKSVTLIARPENWGANRSVGEAIKSLVTQFGRLIFMEDDILASKYYLSYMNWGLETYADDERVFAICGYRSPFPMPSNYKHDIFLMHRYSPWGIGIWDKKYNAVELRSKNRYGELMEKHPDLFISIQEQDPCFIKLLKGDSEGAIKALDTRIEYHLFLSGQVCVYPYTTMTNVLDSGNDSMHGGMRWFSDENLAQRPVQQEEGIDVMPDSLFERLMLQQKYPTRVRRLYSGWRRYGTGWMMRYFFTRIMARLGNVSMERRKVGAE